MRTRVSRLAFNPGTNCTVDAEQKALMVSGGKLQGLSLFAWFWMLDGCNNPGFSLGNIPRDIFGVGAEI